MQHPDDEEPARAGIDRRAKRRGHLRAAVAQEADGVGGHAAGFGSLLGREERVGIAQLLLPFAAGVRRGPSGRERAAGLQHGVDVAGRAERRVRHAPRRRAALVDQPRLPEVHACFEERQRQRRSEHLARAGDDLVELRSGQLGAQRALALPPADQVVGALIGFERAQRGDLRREVAVQALRPVTVGRLRCHFFVRAAHQQGGGDCEDQGGFGHEVVLLIRDKQKSTQRSSSSGRGRPTTASSSGPMRAGR